MIQIEKFKAGEIRQSIGYKYFLPHLVNTNWTWNDAKVNKLIEQASFQLGQLNSYAKLVPNIDLFIHLSKMIDLKLHTEQMIQAEFGKRIKTGLLLHNHLLKQPLVSIKEVQEVCSLSPKNAGDLVNLFEQKKLLNEYTGQHRNRIFIYQPYLNLFEPK